MTKKTATIVQFNHFKAKREREAESEARKTQEEAERLATDPPHKAFHDVMTPTPVNPHNIRYFLDDLLYSLKTRLKEILKDDPDMAAGVYSAHLRLTSHSFAKDTLTDSAMSFEADKKHNDPNSYDRITRKALRDGATASETVQKIAVKQAFMMAMVGETYAYRAVARQLKDVFPSSVVTPGISRISPTDFVPTIELSVPHRQGHDLIAMIERYNYKHDQKNQDGSLKPPPHLSPIK